MKRENKIKSTSNDLDNNILFSSMSLEDKSKIGLVTHTWPELSVVIFKVIFLTSTDMFLKVLINK